MTCMSCGRKEPDMGLWGPNTQTRVDGNAADFPQTPVGVTESLAGLYPT